MGSQIIRVASYTSGSINAIGREEYRARYNHKNTNIDIERSRLNVSIGNKQATLYQAWKDRVDAMGLRFAGKKDQVAMEQMLVTASPDFFKNVGWDKEAARGWEQADIPREIKQYFNDSLRFMKDYLGKENIISATIHFDEETPHLHVDYIPSISGKQKRKDVYLKDADGKCIRNEKGHAIRAKDANGKTLYEYVDEPPSVNRSQFWAERGGRQSYRTMQDLFHERVASSYGLDRGEIGSDRKHEDQAKHKTRQIKKAMENSQRELKEVVTERDRTRAEAQGYKQLAEDYKENILQLADIAEKTRNPLADLAKTQQAQTINDIVTNSFKLAKKNPKTLKHIGQMLEAAATPTREQTRRRDQDYER